NYVLIDYENVQPEAISALDQEYFKVIVFVGATQSKVTYEVAIAMQKLGNKAEYIKIAGNGPNALDFHIAFYIGRISAKEPDTYFHIVSKDTGFDPLIAHLKNLRIPVQRSKDISEIQIVKASISKTIEEKIIVVTDYLKSRGTAVPKTIKTLTSTIQSVFQKNILESEQETIIAALQEQGAIAVVGSKVSYNLN
ncbi:MAG: PIN domain-containing protein, partial [Burkholderiaceae bacterium]